MADLTPEERQARRAELLTGTPNAPETGLMTHDMLDEVARNKNQQGFLQNVWDAAVNDTIFSAGVEVVGDETAGNRRDIFRALGYAENLTRDDMSLGTYLAASGAAVIASVFGRRESKPNYNKEAEYDQLTRGIPWQYHDEIMENDNLGAATRQAARIRKSLRYDQRVADQFDDGLAPLWGTIIDIDAPLIFVSGGTFGAAKAAGTVSNGLRAIGATEKTQRAAAKLAQTSWQGGVQGFSAGVLFNHLQETATWEDVAIMGAAGIALGVVASPLANVDNVFEAQQRRLQAQVKRTREDFEHRVSVADEDLYRDPVDVDHLEAEGVVDLDVPNPADAPVIE